MNLSPERKVEYRHPNVDPAPTFLRGRFFAISSMLLGILTCGTLPFMLACRGSIVEAMIAVAIWLASFVGFCLGLGGYFFTRHRLLARTALILTLLALILSMLDMTFPPIRKDF
jgi:TRAP-type uncharacterized transport system fused permease subunit